MRTPTPDPTRGLAEGELVEPTQQTCMKSLRRRPWPPEHGQGGGGRGRGGEREGRESAKRGEVRRGIATNEEVQRRDHHMRRRGREVGRPGTPQAVRPSGFMPWKEGTKA